MNILVIVELYFHKNKSGGEAYLHHFLKKVKQHTNANIEVLLPKQKEDKKYEFEGIIINETIESVEDCEVYVEKADCVVTQLMLSSKVIEMALEKDKEIIWILHGYFAGFHKLMKHDRVIKIFNSRNVLIDFSTKSNEKINNYFIIYPFTDFPLLSQYKDKELDRREYITFVNPVKNKGTELILKLAKRNSDKKFLIVEGGYCKEEQQQYITRFRELSNVHIIKNTKDIINEIYLKSKIVIMASHYESYGMVASEARCFGIPVIINKNTKGLVENMGQLCLGGEGEETSEYQKIIDALDIPAMYHIWSNFYFESAEERYNEIEYQYEQFFKCVFKRVDESTKQELQDQHQDQ